MKFIDRTGQRFGSLTVIKDVRGEFVCRCDCGKERTGSKAHVVNGNTKSCGCISAGRGFETIVGQKRKMLTCVEEHRDDGSITVECECGTKKKINRRNFGSSVSCGCKTRRIVKINGDSKSLAAWARVIGVSRERARILHNDGKLEDRVLAKAKA